MDLIDRMQEQWQTQNAMMQTEDMALISRFLIVSNHMNEAMEQALATFDMKLPSYGVLAALLRTGAPHALTPNELLAQTLITSGAMTNRINKLEKKKFIKRIPSKQDKRSFKVALTDEGKAITEKAVIAVNAQYKTLTEYFKDDDKGKLNAMLKGYLAHVDIKVASKHT